VSRRDAVRRKPHPKIQPEKLHPQIGYRRFTPARGGQVPWERRRPRRHTAQLRPRGQVPWERRRPRRHTGHPSLTGCAAFCWTVEPVHSSPRARASAPRLNLSSSDPCAPWQLRMDGDPRHMAASGRRRLQSDPKTPPPNRLPPIHPRPRGTGTLGAPTSSSAHGSAPPDRLHCVLPDGRTRSLISASEGKCAASESLQFGSLCPLVTGWTEARVTWLRVAADDYNPTPKLHPQIGYRRFTPTRGGQVPWERRRPRRHTAQLRPRG
jgi:hypothetical protein